MSKVLLLGDTHFGARGGSQRFHDFFRMFFDDVLFPYIREHNIKEIYQLGDLWDQRKQIHVSSIKQAREYFFDKIVAHDVHMTTLVGNHDIVFRNSCATNSSELLLDGYAEHVTVISKPTEISFGETTALVLPWICDDNLVECQQMIKATSSPVCLSHLELQGFEAFRGHQMTSGMSAQMFAQFDSVFTGHYHHRSCKDNILYVGTPYEMSWSDFMDPKGFHVLDTVTGDIEFVQNPYRMFHKVEYREEIPLEQYDLDRYKSCYVRVNVVNKTNQFKFEKFIDSLSAARPHDIKVIEEAVVDANSEIELADVHDTITLIQQFVEQLTVSGAVDKKEVYQYIHNLYVEAQLVEG